MAVPDAQLQTERQRPPANVAPVALPSFRDILDRAGSVPFAVCSQRTGWQRPSPDEMTAVFTDRRFGDGVAPFPPEYTYYLRPFFFPTPFSESANKYGNAFGGFWDNSGTLEQFCDLPQMRKQGGWHSFTAIGYQVVAVQKLGDSFVVLVSPGFDGWQNVVFPYPPDPSMLHGGPLFTSSQVIDTKGHVLYQELRPANAVAWQQSQQYDPAGRLEFLSIGGILPYASVPITIEDGQPALMLYSSHALRSITPGSLRAFDSSGKEVARIDWQSSTGPWQPQGRLDLPPGTYTLLFDDQSHDWHHFTLLAADVPLPPGVR